jgi:hypothetical protein
VLKTQTLGTVAAGPVISLTSASTAQTLPQLLNNGTPPNGAHQGTFSNTGGANILAVSGASGGYVPAFANSIKNGAGDANDYVQVNGFNPAKDAPEIYALKLNNNGTYINPSVGSNASVIAAIIADINTSNSATFGGSIASTVSGQLASIFSGYDVLVTIPGTYINGLTIPGSGAQVDFGFDFTNYSDTTVGIATGGLTTSDIGVIPEPGSLGLLAIGGMGLLARRKRRTAK